MKLVTNPPTPCRICKDPSAPGNMGEPGRPSWGPRWRVRPAMWSAGSPPRRGGARGGGEPRRSQRVMTPKGARTRGHESQRAHVNMSKLTRRQAKTSQALRRPMITLGRSLRLNHRHSSTTATAGHLGRPLGLRAEKPRLVALPLPPSPAGLAESAPVPSTETALPTAGLTLHRGPHDGRPGFPGADGSLPIRHGVGGFTTNFIHS